MSRVVTWQGGVNALNLKWQNAGLPEVELVSHSELKALRILILGKIHSCVDYCKNYQDFKESRHNSILLLGQVGCGKTHLALASANALLDYQKIRVVYMPYREMITRLKQNITDEDSYTRTIDTFKTAPMLVIDDLLKGKTTESDINILFEIVNYRYVCNLPVIVTSEKTTGELLDFDSAIGSRLVEMAEGRIIEFKGNELNYRLKGINT